MPPMRQPLSQEGQHRRLGLHEVRLPLHRRRIRPIYEGGPGLSENPLIIYFISLFYYRLAIGEMTLSEPIHATVTVELATNLAEMVEGSLLPEVESPTSERSIVKVTVDGGVLKVTVEASDVSALRAALNSYLRWVSAILDVVETVE